MSVGQPNLLKSNKNVIANLNCKAKLIVTQWSRKCWICNPKFWCFLLFCNFKFQCRIEFVTLLHHKIDALSIANLTTIKKLLVLNLKFVCTKKCCAFKLQKWCPLFHSFRNFNFCNFWPLCNSQNQIFESKNNGKCSNENVKNVRKCTKSVSRGDTTRTRTFQCHFSWKMIHYGWDHIRDKILFDWKTKHCSTMDLVGKDQPKCHAGPPLTVMM